MKDLCYTDSRMQEYVDKQRSAYEAYYYALCQYMDGRGMNRIIRLIRKRYELNRATAELIARRIRTRHRRLASRNEMEFTRNGY